MTVKEPKLGKEELKLKHENEVALLRRKASFGTPQKVPFEKGDGSSISEAQAHVLGDRDEAHNVTSSADPQAPSESAQAGSHPATPGIIEDPRNISHVRVASKLFTEKWDAINSRGSGTSDLHLATPQKLVGRASNYAAQGTIIGEDPRSCLTHSRSHSRDDLTQSLTPSTPPRDHSASTPSTPNRPNTPSTPPRDYSASTPTTPNRPNSTPNRPPATQSATLSSPARLLSTSAKKAQSSVGHLVAQFNLPAASDAPKGPALHQTYPTARRSKSGSTDSEEVGEPVASPTRRAPSPFTRADPKIASPKHFSNTSSDLKSTRSSRFSSCQIVDSNRRQERAPAAGFKVARSSHADLIAS